ncbi:MAG TPA: dihydropteroate synthase [Myxococcota bacterium]|nr:dihydropteroate synthase [Myxococcota bacterium]
MSAPRPDMRTRALGFPGAGERVLVVGIVNVTPDSFYDGGRFASAEAALAHGLELAESGADWLDVGGESTRPGALPIAVEEELARVVPVIEGLAKRCTRPISIDTRRAEVAERALAAGASIVNAVAGLRDAELAAVCAAHGAGLVINHMRGEPATMQRAAGYTDVVREVAAELLADAEAALRAGVARERIWLDPGIGFGKRARKHSVVLIARLRELVELGYPVLVGPSRKSFLGALTGAEVEERLPGSLAAAAACVLAGARALRMHDVAAARQAVDVAAAIRDARAGAP